MTGPSEATNAARAIALLAHMTEFFRASRVVDFHPLFQLASRLSRLHMASPDQAAGPQQPAAHGITEHLFAVYGGWGPGMPDQAMRLSLAIVYAHGKAVGASGGPAALGATCGAWAPALSKGDISLVLRFVAGVLAAPAGLPAQALGPQLLTALARALVGDAAMDEGGSSVGDYKLTARDAMEDGAWNGLSGVSVGESGPGSQWVAVQGCALLLLGDLCNVLRPEVCGCKSFCPPSAARAHARVSVCVCVCVCVCARARSRACAR
jgi:hypothetical protein